MNEQTKTRRIIIAVIFILLVVTAIAAVLYLSGRQKVKEGELILAKDGKEKVIYVSSYRAEEISGTTVNGKGEEKTISGEGIQLALITGKSGFKEITVTSDDAYSATVMPEDMENAYLMIEEGKVRLVVLGDQTPKRNVKNVVRIEVIGQ